MTKRVGFFKDKRLAELAAALTTAGYRFERGPGDKEHESGTLYLVNGRYEFYSDSQGITRVDIASGVKRVFHTVSLTRAELLG